jgi:hypothetical protein
MNNHKKPASQQRGSITKEDTVIIFDVYRTNTDDFYRFFISYIKEIAAVFKAAACQ